MREVIRITKKQFRHDFLRGLGSAMIELQDCENPQRYYDVVLYGCIHNTTYDMQCEGNRGWYLHQAAMLVGGAAILQGVIERYSRPIKDTWLFDQLTSLLYHFSSDGNTHAREAVYNQYVLMLNKLTLLNTTKNRLYPERGIFDWLCVWLTSLDGWGAFKKITMDVSANLLTKGDDFFFSEWFYDNSKGKFGEKRVTAYLQKQAEKSDAMRLFLQEAIRWDNHLYQKTPPPTLEDVIAALDGERFHGRGIAMRFAWSASDSDIEKLMEIALQEPNERKKAELLWGLRKAKYPFSDSFVSELLQSENEDIRDTAFYIMEHFPSPKMREYALSLLQKDEDTINAISLLAKNLLPQDEQLLYDKVKVIPIKISEGDWHSAFMSAEGGIKNLRGKPKTNILEYMYRETYCGSCRERIVSLMHKKRVLSKRVLQECLYDSNDDIRSFAERIKNRNRVD